MRNRCAFGCGGSDDLCIREEPVSQLSMPNVRAHMALPVHRLENGREESCERTAASAQRVRLVVALPEGRGTLCYCSSLVTALAHHSCCDRIGGGRTHCGSGYLIIINVSSCNLAGFEKKNTDPLQWLVCCRCRCWICRWTLRFVMSKFA